MSKVFVAGCGRSGTSYLRTIIDAHPQIFIPNECLFLVDYLKYGNRVPVNLLRWLFFREPQLRCFYERGAFQFSKIHEAIARVHEVEAAEFGATIWGQKTPRFVRHLDLFDSAFNDIYWLLIYRDPRAVAASMRQSSQHPSSLSRICKRWRRDNAPIINLLDGKSDRSNVMLVKYEELITDYENSIAQIFDYLQVPPITAAEVNARGRPVFFKRSRFKMNTIRGDLYPNPEQLTNWKTELSNTEIAYIESQCMREMQLMGYEPIASGKPGKAGLQGWKDGAIVVQYLLKWPEYLFFTVLRKMIFTLFRWRSPS